MENTLNKTMLEAFKGIILTGYNENHHWHLEQAAESTTLIAEQFADEQTIKILKILTSEETPFSILYSNHAERFSDGYNDYTPEEMLTLLKGEYPELFHKSREISGQ